MILFPHPGLWHTKDKEIKEVDKEDEFINYIFYLLGVNGLFSPLTYLGHCVPTHKWSERTMGP